MKTNPKKITIQKRRPETSWEILIETFVKFASILLNLIVVQNNNYLLINLLFFLNNIFVSILNFDLPFLLTKKMIVNFVNLKSKGKKEQNF